MRNAECGMRSALAAISFMAGMAHACTVPVFRYALERWPADAHVMMVASNAVPAEAVMADPGHANLWIERAHEPQEVAVRVLYPRTEHTWYEGEWDKDLPTRLADSPLRRQLAHDLATGTTAAFVLLESSNSATNRAIHRMLEEQLDALTREIALEKQPDYEDDADGWSGPGMGQDLSRVPLQIAFSLHSVARDNAAERFLVDQFIAMNPSLEDPSEAAVGVVFGRGRTILLQGEELMPEIIEEICRFLSGACSCRVKAMNPGVDLLIAANWDEAVFGYPEPAVTLLPDSTEFTLGGTGTVELAEEGAAGIDPSLLTCEPGSSSCCPLKRIWIPILLCAAIGVWVIRKTQPEGGRDER